MTHGQLITRLCKIRDDLTDTVVQLKDAPVEWIKENPEGCDFCRGEELSVGDDLKSAMLLYKRTVYDDGRPRTLWALAVQGISDTFKVSFCPLCGRDLRGT